MIREGSLVGWAALEDIEIDEQVGRISVRLERKNAKACRWMTVVGRLLRWRYVPWPHPISPV